MPKVKCTCTPTLIERFGNCVTFWWSTDNGHMTTVKLRSCCFLWWRSEFSRKLFPDLIRLYLKASDSPTYKCAHISPELTDGGRLKTVMSVPRGPLCKLRLPLLEVVVSGASLLFVYELLHCMIVKHFYESRLERII